MTKHDKIVYLAGILDGEGCFNVSRCRDSYVPRLLVTNTSKELVDWLKTNFGGDISRTIVKGKDIWKPRYMWRLSHRKAQELAREVRPYLKIKWKQANYFIVWSAIQDVYKRPERKPWYELLAKYIKSLNTKGLVLSRNY